MRVEEPSAAQPDQPVVPPAGPEQTASQAALARYAATMRRSRLGYALAVVAVVAVVAAWVGVAWSRGEITHVRVHTVASAPASVAVQSPAASVQPVWHTSDRTAIGTPYWGGTVVTYTSDSVRGRDARTGAVTWSYTRTDRQVCQAIQDQGVTVTIFADKGNCDEVTALDSGTGTRKWTRTLDQDAMPLNGHPTYAVTPYTIMLTTPQVIYAFDPGGGLTRWTFTQPGCTINSAVLGSQGALISQTCAAPKCSGLSFCGPGPQLLLRDPTAARSDDASAKGNPDQIKWNLIGSGEVPASADQLISAVDPATDELKVLDVTKGASLATLPLRAAPAGPGSIVAVATARAELLWIEGITYSVQLTGAAFFWVTSTAGPPTVTPLPGRPANTTDLSESTLAVAGPGAITLLDPGTGRTTRTFPVPVPEAPSTAYPFGTGFVLAGPTTAVYQ